MSPRKMARALGVSEGAVMNWVRKGIVPARKEGRFYTIPEIAAHSFIERWKWLVPKTLLTPPGTPATAPPPEGLIRRARVMEILGVSARTVNNLRERGMLNGYLVGNGWRYQEEDVRALAGVRRYLRAGQVADILGVTRNMVWQFTKQGRLKTLQPPISWQNYYAPAEVERFARTYVRKSQGGRKACTP